MANIIIEECKRLKDKIIENTETLHELETLSGKIPEDDLESIREGFLWSSDPFRAKFTLTMKNGSPLREKALLIMKGVGAKRAEKSFEESTGKVSYNIDLLNVPGGKPLRLEVTGGDPVCKIKEVSERVWVSPTEGRYENKTRFVVENPEECFSQPVEEKEIKE